ncbi:NAD(P)-dependent malic enzyme [Kurthia sibirica]|uniref:NAD-dependent malic enzyme n=2 Tax=Kurthia sibirica TaxID=202750 RepID=A0A2U3ALB1_9BACL|nr:malic enzyme-like NAD(P)-binding protein [Kurthia sibirica]PWI25311.1 NAD-dependent malic enzyme [Kurthia sibirica]
MNTNLRVESLELHEALQGKLTIQAKMDVKSSKELSLVYSPGVAEPCLEIKNDPNKVYDYTMKGNLVGIVTDGTAVLGLGDIGPKAAMPVMEGKALLLKQFAGIDAMPICLDTKDVDEIVSIVKNIAPTFGAINLEDISAPRCFEIEDRLRKECDIPVFHDDQHGTAIVVAAGLKNAMRIVRKSRRDVKIVINGAGAAGVAILKLLLTIGYKNFIVCDSKGIIYEGRPYGMNAEKELMAQMSNIDAVGGSLEDAIIDADIFIGVSAADVLTEKMVKSMMTNPIIFALANPNPEISFENAQKWGVNLIATGRSDYPNQVNNMLAFPGIFKGALEVRATDINDEMKMAAVHAIADLVTDQQIHDGVIIPNIFEIDITDHVAVAVMRAAIHSEVAQKIITLI